MKKQYNTTWIQPQRPESFDDPDHDIKYKQRSHDLPKDKSNIDNSCDIAWNSITVDAKNRVFICTCDGHLPFPVGKVNDFKSFDEVFRSPMAINIQESISEKKFRYCATDHCGIKNQNMQRYPNGYYLLLSIDTSCNLRCPSCRERLIFINDKNLLRDKFSTIESIISWIRLTNKKVYVELAGGDPFASLIYIDMMEVLSQLPNVRFVIRTNGLLIKNNFNKLKNIFNKIDDFIISIDAATKQTYEQVRLGGKWEHLLDNLDFLRDKVKKKPMAGFVVQKNNLDDVIPFVEFCQQHDLKPSYWVVQDWGTWHDFSEHCVHLSTSKHYTKFVNIINDPIFKKKRVNIDQLRAWA